jgi:predicted  nucleic acid-binding Zn-ribbon protein
MDRLNQEIKKKKEELNRAMTERMEIIRNDKDIREKYSMIQYEVNQIEEDLRRLMSKVK